MTALPFGLRQVKLVPVSSTGLEITAQAQMLPASRTFSFSESEDFENLDGDDRRWASHGSGPTVEWDLEGGGISLEVWAILSGATVTSGGGTKTLTKLVEDSRPEFNVYGRAISDSGGDFHMVVYRCKSDGSLEASMENGSFLLTTCSGTGFGENKSSGAKLYEFLHNDTVTPFDPATGKTNWAVTVTGTPTGGTYSIGVDGMPTSAIDHDADGSEIADAINGLTGITGVTATGSGSGTLVLGQAARLTIASASLTGGTAPSVSVA